MAIAGLLAGSARAESIPTLTSDNLGPANIALASGSSALVAGVGLSLGQPGTINFTVPAGHAIKQVLLYWEGAHGSAVQGDNTIVVNSVNAVIGTKIGSVQVIPTYTSTAFRADITSLVSPASGAKSIKVEGLNNSVVNNGAGVLVILDDGTAHNATIAVRDGDDFAYIHSPGTLHDTALQSYSFASSSTSRVAQLSMMFASVRGANSSQGFRPNSIEIKVGGVTTKASNLLGSGDGEEWDSQNLLVTIPAGVSNMSVQVFSRDDNNTGALPASLVWVCSALSVLPPGGEEGCSATFWKDKKNKSKWVGYTTDTKLKSVFAKADDKTCKDYGKDGDKKFIEALGWGTATGKLHDAFKNLMREAVAALLNASHPGVDYPATPAEVVLMVNDALTSCDAAALTTLANELKAANNAGSVLCRPGTGTGNCTTAGRPNKLTFTYTGGSCAAAVNSQQPPAYTGKYSCTEANGGLTGAAARIIVTGSSTAPTTGSARYFDGQVNVGGAFDVLSGASTFGAFTYVYIYEGGVLKQSIAVHTSCSAPLVRTETFGGLVLDDYAIVP